MRIAVSTNSATDSMNWTSRAHVLNVTKSCWQH